MASTEPTEKPPTAGLVAGKYEIVRLLGRGGMGSVWEARHVSLGTKVAIKFVEVEEAQSEEARARFQNEARAAATIQSKHAIKVYDHGLLDDGRPYIVMELLLGEALDARLQLVQRISLPEVARLVQQIARALQQAHDAGITHRDLKPENIFLERNADDEVDVAKVLDFGIAKIRDAASSPVPSTTKTGVLMGTPFFMSPEQARGMKTVDHRSDLWSLAVIVFRCATGKLPFDGESLGDLLVKICAAPLPMPSSVLAGLPPQFDAWMQKALDRDPDLRFQTAYDFAEALAMVAGVSVRLSSRRSSDFTPRPARSISQTPIDPGAPTSPEALPFQAGDLHRQPIPLGTSSPLTASATPLPMQRGVGTGALSVVAALLLVATAGGGFYWFTHRSTGGVAVAGGVATQLAAGAGATTSAPPNVASSATAPATGTPPSPPSPDEPVAAAVAQDSQPGIAVRTPASVPVVSHKYGIPGAHAGGAAPKPPSVAAAKPPAPAVAVQPSSHPPSPPTISGSDPGY